MVESKSPTTLARASVIYGSVISWPGIVTLGRCVVTSCARYGIVQDLRLMSKSLRLRRDLIEKVSESLFRNAFGTLVNYCVGKWKKKRLLT